MGRLQTRVTNLEAGIEGQVGGAMQKVLVALDDASLAILAAGRITPTLRARMQALCTPSEWDLLARFTDLEDLG